jgi:hypothetical protein
MLEVPQGIGDATCTNLGYLHARVSIEKRLRIRMYLDVPEYIYTDAGIHRKRFASPADPFPSRIS